MSVARPSPMIVPSMVMESRPIISRVVAALRLFGFLKAGTPLEIASTPVRAAQPDEKARSSRKALAIPTMASWSGSGISSNCALSAWPRLPVTAWKTPTIPIPTMPRMNAYTGTAKALPDSRTPLRFIAVRKTTSPTATSTSCPRSDGMAVAAFCTPDETETATVRT